MPPRRIRVLPIWIWSPSRIFGTPVMSAALRHRRQQQKQNRKQNFMNMQRPIRCINVRIVGGLHAPAGDCAGADFRFRIRMQRACEIGCVASRHFIGDARADPARTKSAGTPPPRIIARRASASAHQHEGRGDLGAADQNARRRLHLVPLIGLERPVPAAFAERG